jgi:hypothetical protein
MKISPVKIKANDFPKEHIGIATALGGLLNPFFDKVVMGFNKNLTVEENLPFELKTITIKVNSSGSPYSNNILQTGLTDFKGFICISLTDVNNTGSYPSSTPFIIYDISGSTITIRKVVGIPAEVTYNLVLLGIS